MCCSFRWSLESKIGSSLDIAWTKYITNMISIELEDEFKQSNS